MPRNYSIKDTIEQEKQRRASGQTQSQNITKTDTKPPTIENIEENYATPIISMNSTEDIPVKPKGFFSKLFGWR
jgi:hypothetical protein